MIRLTAQAREQGKDARTLRREGLSPAILYGPKTESLQLAVAHRDFETAWSEAGESSLVSLESGGETYPVLIHEVQRDPLSGKPLHADFYQPPLDEKIEVSVPLVFQGEAAAVRDLLGTLLKNMYEVEVRALPQNLPHEIIVNVEGLKTFEDRILVQDLQVPDGVELTADPGETVAQAVPAEDVEAELSRPVEERVEQVEKVEEKAKEEAAEQETEE